MADSEEGFDIDPAIAAAMGFSGFGAQASKKRKFDSNDGFVDPNISTASTQKQQPPTGKGANAVKLGDRTVAKTAAHPPGGTEQGSALSAQNVAGGNAGSASGVSAGATGQGTKGASLEALRNGVRNENGDMVYFLPSFIEDPWKDLVPK
jgi:hypothetical protein